VVPQPRGRRAARRVRPGRPAQRLWPDHHRQRRDVRRDRRLRRPERRIRPRHLPGHLQPARLHHRQRPLPQVQRERASQPLPRTDTGWAGEISLDLTSSTTSPAATTAPASLHCAPLIPATTARPGSAHPRARRPPRCVPRPAPRSPPLPTPPRSGQPVTFTAVVTSAGGTRPAT
jgi:hypothetical protein